MIILSGSPRRGGNSDTAAALLQKGLTASGVSATLRTVRDGLYRPCVACGFCERHPGQCTLNTSGDDTAELLAALRNAPALLLVLPVFFYGPPAQCKAIMDRAQTFWWLNRPDNVGKVAVSPPRPVFMVHIAGRAGGARLFEANGLIGRCFARTLGFAPLPDVAGGDVPPAALCLPGLDGPSALADDAALCERVRAYGQAVGTALVRPV